MAVFFLFSRTYRLVFVTYYDDCVLISYKQRGFYEKSHATTYSGNPILFIITSTNARALQRGTR